jgi:hypothetical protein
MSEHAPATTDGEADASDRTTNDADVADYIDETTDHWRTMAGVLVCAALAGFGLVSKQAPFGYVPVFLGLAGVLALFVYQSMDATRDLRTVA